MRKQLNQTKRHSESGEVSRAQWFLYGLLTGIIACVVLSTTPWQSVSQQFAAKIKKHTITPEFAQKNQEQKPQFDFYSMLPQMDVPSKTITTNNKETKSPVQQKTDNLQTAKSPQKTFFILQAASFIQNNEAERMKAQLLLAGFDANIQVFLKDNKKWYRVMVGPFSDANDAHKEQKRLKNERVDSLLITQDTEQNKVG